MRTRIKTGIHIFLFLVIASLPIKVLAEDVSSGASSGEVIEVEEGIFQVVEDELYRDDEYGDDIESIVDESSTGSDNGTFNDSGQYDEQASQEGSNYSDASQTETVESSNGESQTTMQIDLSVIEGKLDVIQRNQESLHEDLLKVMISMWALTGLLLGTKLIKGMFGYG